MNPPSGSVSSSRRIVTGTAAVLAVLAVLALLTAAACGSSPTAVSRSPQPSTTNALQGATPRIAVTYEDHGHSSEGAYRTHAVLVAAGPNHVRYEIKATGFAPMLFIYDGQRLLVHDPEEYRPWSLYEAPQEHPDMFEVVSAVFADPNSAEFTKGCRSATVVGHKRILGRSAVGYHCATQHFADGSVYFAGVTWLDQKTAVLLQSGGFHATSIDEHPPVTEATFSTTPPKGAKVAVYAAQKRPAGPLTKAPDFELKRVAGSADSGGSGLVRLSDYAHQPLVLAFFFSELTFDPHGEECPGCVDSLLTLQQLTDRGTSTAVLAVQEGDEGKPGDPLIPKGLRLDVVNDPDLEVQHSYGLSEQIGFAFIGSDGMVHQVFDKAPTDQQLKDALDALH